MDEISVVVVGGARVKARRWGRGRQSVFFLAGCIARVFD